ncbi:MAG: tetratricopeptide repeat protein [Candidatus Zambryskibacteria bacterium]|nr:tetratricopeptide repeat protein [Candidatus Zambryskibacteria bacterium]
MEENNQGNTGSAILKKLGLVLSVFVFLLPVFFMPVSGINLYVAKIALLATGLVAIFALFLTSVLSIGSIEIPKAKYLIPIGAFVLVALISSAFSGAIKDSITGSVFEPGTSGFFLMLAFLLFLVIVSIKNTKLIERVFTAFIYSMLVLAAYTLLGILFSPILPGVIASKLPVFLTGGPIDTAIILGASVILSLCALNMTEISKRIKYILSALIVFSLVFIGATNFTPTVVVLGVISLIFFVYILSWSVGNRSREVETNPEMTDDLQMQPDLSAQSNRKIPLSSLIVLVASIVLLLGGSVLGSFLSKTMKIQSAEIRPNFQTTMNLTKESWKENFALGIGPNRFAEFWALNKPTEINQTQFWNAEFNSGSGFVPTIAITTGLLGLLSLLVFLVLYVPVGVKAIFAQANSSRSRYLATSAFLMSLYLWLMLFFYTPSVVVLALAFIFTGLFTATLVPQGIIGLKKINIFSNPKTNFLSVLSIVILLIVSVAGGYFVWEKAVASVIFEKGTLAYQRTGNIESTRQSIARSISISQNDIYWQGLTEISLTDLGNALNNLNSQMQPSEATIAKAQQLIVDLVESAKKAVELNDKNFQNWFILGRVYEILAANGIEGAITNSQEAYQKAAELSPKNPSVPLALSRLNALAGDLNEAKLNISRALELKNNYTDAFFTLAQLEVASNNIPGAVRSVEAATLFDPNNAGLYFQLGLLKYNQRDFAGAVGAFERAIALIKDYANAKYYLGLSYYQLGQTEKALKEFEDINLTNPNNQEILTIIDNLKNGRSLFGNSGVNANLEALPVEEE